MVHARDLWMTMNVLCTRSSSVASGAAHVLRPMTVLMLQLAKYMRIMYCGAMSTHQLLVLGDCHHLVLRQPNRLLRKGGPVQQQRRAGVKGCYARLSCREVPHFLLHIAMYV